MWSELHLYQFWGKIRDAKEGTVPAWHHMLTRPSHEACSHDGGCPWAHVHRTGGPSKGIGWKVKNSCPYGGTVAGA